MKKVIVVVTMALVAFLMCATLVFATGPTDAGGARGYAPATGQANLIILPHSDLPIGTATTIEEGGTTITVSAIPDEAHMLLKVSRAYMESYPEWTKQAWVKYCFWLNGSGPVTITRDDGTTQTVEEVTEFIFLKVQYVGPGEGNSDYDAGRNFDVTIQAYK